MTGGSRSTRRFLTSDSVPLTPTEPNARARYAPLDTTRRNGSEEGLAAQHPGELFEARLPSNACRRASLARSEAGVAERDPRAAVGRLKVVRHGGGRAGQPPRVHESPRRVDFGELALERVGLSAPESRTVP